MGAKALGLGAVVAASGVAGGLVSLLDPGAAAERVVFGFLLGALPAIGLDLASGFIGATAPEEVGDALLAGLPGRAAARASAAGRTLAALSGGAAICAFVGVFESTDVAPVAIAAFLAGTLSTSVVVSLMRDDGPGRAMGVRRDQTPTGGAARSPGRTPLPAVTLGAYELLALGLGASTLIIAETPLELGSFFRTPSSCRCWSRRWGWLGASSPVRSLGSSADRPGPKDTVPGSGYQSPPAS